MSGKSRKHKSYTYSREKRNPHFALGAFKGAVCAAVPKTSLTAQQQSNGWMEGRGGIITSVLLELHAKREACKETSKTV